MKVTTQCLQYLADDVQHACSQVDDAVSFISTHAMQCDQAHLDTLKHAHAILALTGHAMRNMASKVAGQQL